MHLLIDPYFVKPLARAALLLLRYFSRREIEKGLADLSIFSDLKYKLQQTLDNVTSKEVSDMSEMKIETLIRNFLDAYMKQDVDGTLSFFAENAIWQVSEGVFKGNEAKRYLTWVFKMNPQIKFKDVGIGLVVKGNKAVYEYMLEAVTSQGMKFETPGICIYEVVDDKIKQHKVLYDRLSVAKQAAKGVVSKRVVNSVLNAMEKGLR